MIHYVTGDATDPQGTGPKLIAHVTNNSGGWGRGFVLAVSKRWRAPEARYRHRHEERRLGITQFVQVTDEITVANMCAQDGYPRRERPVPIDYVALEECLVEIAHYAGGFVTGHAMTVHMPRIGCGLGGGDWRTVEWILNRKLLDIPVTVYDLPA